MKNIFIYFCILFITPVFAEDCVSYKLTPEVLIEQPKWTQIIQQANITKDKMHGSVESTFISAYNLYVSVFPVANGYCVSLKKIDAQVGIEKFHIKIDYSHKPNSCSYNVVMEHEEKHIKTYLDIIDEFQPEIKSSLFYAADSAMPVFISDKSEVENAVDLLNEKISSHPDVLLLWQKINAAQEIRNKEIDQNENYEKLNLCNK